MQERPREDINYGKKIARESRLNPRVSNSVPAQKSTLCLDYCHSHAWTIVLLYLACAAERVLLRALTFYLCIPPRSCDRGPTAFRSFLSSCYVSAVVRGSSRSEGLDVGRRAHQTCIAKVNVNGSNKVPSGCCSCYDHHRHPRPQHCHQELL